MSDTSGTSSTTEDPDKGEQLKQQARDLVENLKQEIAARLDQFLDQLGAKI